jgi:hypothetical protein
MSGGSPFPVGNPAVQSAAQPSLDVQAEWTAVWHVIKRLVRLP